MLKNDSKVFVFVRDYSLDAAGALILFLRVFKNVNYRFVKYNLIDNCINDKILDNYEYIFFLGLAPSYKENIKQNFIVFANQDTYSFLRGVNNVSVWLNLGLMKNVRNFLSKKFCVDLANFELFCDLAQDYSLKTWNDKRCISLNWIFGWYTREKFLERFKDGFSDFNVSEQKIIDDKREELKQTIENLEVKDVAESICLLALDNFLDEVEYYLLKKRNYRFVLVYMAKSRRLYLRTSSNDIDLREVVKQFPNSGGMSKSVSVEILDSKDFQTKIKLIAPLLKIQ